jgi:hypothetical protein
MGAVEFTAVTEVGMVSLAGSRHGVRELSNVQPIRFAVPVVNTRSVLGGTSHEVGFCARDHQQRHLAIGQRASPNRNHRGLYRKGVGSVHVCLDTHEWQWTICPMEHLFDSPLQSTYCRSATRTPLRLSRQRDRSPS